MGNKVDINNLQRQVNYLKERYRFKGVLHFTDFSNLESIFKEGFLHSRTYCENNGIDFIDGAEHSVLDKASNYVHDCVRFYYRGKSPTLYNNEGIKLKEYCDEVHIPTPVFLLFSEDLIYFNTTEFSDGNATNSSIGNDSEFFNNMDWDAIFHDTWFDPEDRDYIVNKRQAELLSLKAVSLAYLKEIIFRCDADMKRAINIFGNDKRYKVDMSLFSGKNSKEPKYEWEKNNFIKSYNVKVIEDENAIEIEYKYNNKWKDYTTDFYIFNKNGQIIKDYKKKIWYKNFRGRIIKEPLNYHESKVLRLEGNISNWYKINIAINDFIYIEEYILKNYIVDYNIFLKQEDSKFKLVLYRKFLNKRVFGLNHKYEVLNENNRVLRSGIANFGNDPNGLGWNITFNNYDESWYRINYYIDDVLCISEEIK